MAEHVHTPPGDEIESIGGRFSIVAESCINYRGRTVLYCVGIAIIDRSCCGAGGYRFIHVPGYITDRQYRVDSRGRPISIVQPVNTKQEMKEIKGMLDKLYPHSQVSFGAE